MTDQNVPTNRVVDYGNGPRLFASKVIGFQTVGNGAVTFTLGMGEYRGGRLNEEPTPDNYVFAVVGTVTLTQSACAELVNALNRIAAGTAAMKAEKSERGAN